MDAAFDLVYPAEIQRVSSRFWTPVQAAMTAACWIKASSCTSVLDVGAGVGKFCIVTSLALDHPVTGIEQRSHLVDAARRAAAQYEAPTTFEHGTIEDVDAARFDAFYFFNPFAENVFDADEQLDREVELSERRWFDDLALVERWLSAARDGTLVITYNGFGGRIPGSYRLVRRTFVAGNWLRAWVKSSSEPAPEAFHIEVDDMVFSSAELGAAGKRCSPPMGSERLQALLERPLGLPLR